MQQHQQETRMEVLSHIDHQSCTLYEFDFLWVRIFVKILLHHIRKEAVSSDFVT